MRIILQCPYRTHISDMLNNLKWMSVRQRILYMQCVWMWKVNRGLVPEYLSQNFNTQANYNTRSSVSENYNVEKCNHKTFQYSGTKAWNSLPPSIKSIDNINSFKKSVAQFIFGSYAIHKNNI